MIFSSTKLDGNSIYNVPISYERKANQIIITLADDLSAEHAEKGIDKAVYELKKAVHVYGEG